MNEFDLLKDLSEEAFAELRFGGELEVFLSEIIDPVVARTGVPGVLCNATASGTEVLDRLGEEHVIEHL